MTECLRRAEGVLHSQSTICYRGIYYHCFAVSLTQLVIPFLNRPFWTSDAVRSQSNHQLGFQAGTYFMPASGVHNAGTAFDTSGRNAAPMGKSIWRPITAPNSSWRVRFSWCCSLSCSQHLVSR